MKLLLKVTTPLLAAAILVGFSACERRQHTETNTKVNGNDTVTVKHSTSVDRPNDELRDFRNWVNTQTARADTNAKRRWPKVKEEFNTRSAHLETRLDSLSDDSKREYAALKQRYETWEKKQDERTAQPLNETTLAKWRKELLGERQNLKTMTGANARETYLLFMGIIRAKKSNWTQNDWDYVDHVYGELNIRKEEIESSIPKMDRLKIKTLQSEYLALEGAADAGDAYHNVKK